MMAHGSRRLPRLTLYGRAWCHLCDDMRTQLDALWPSTSGIVVDVVDIDADPVLQAQYDEAVPVLLLDGVELCRYRLDPVRVARALADFDAGRWPTSPA
ncbi:glutaredoxin family protein [Mycetohabitans sp. B2]|jgi:glutaredoxin|uniref:glutaredoxin family protein n=1 Tax=Mycetohabitans sp. B2 TaxID=2841274 RepID=UPI001F2E3B4C|nr:glutaredoxin family protein [Mycetohabitans sp. B2]MCF7695167.1 glutaredoxin family protein [Mycetohabitans sp. B2]